VLQELAGVLRCFGWLEDLTAKMVVALVHLLRLLLLLLLMTSWPDQHLGAML